MTLTLTLLQGDVRAKLAELPAESVHCVVTSVPYWGLRDYGVDGQIGLEPTPEAWVAGLVEVFRGVRRVLRKDGTAFVNCGDAFQDKQLIGQPWRLAFALQADGWWLRSEIIWHKPNPMPGSQRDRPTTSHEQIFLLTRSGSPTFWTHALGEPGTRSRPAPDYYWLSPATGKVRHDDPGDDYQTIWKKLNAWRGHDYFYDEVAVRQPSNDPRAGKPRTDDYGGKSGHDPNDQRPGTWNRSYHPSDATLRDVWTIATEPLKLAHYAAFPREIPRRCIKAGTSERGVCPACGAPWARVVERGAAQPDRHLASMPTGKLATEERDTRDKGWSAEQGFAPNVVRPVTTTGWRPTCAHEAEPIPATCLDPFAGSGTTLLVADELQRSAIGIELSPEYAAMARQRIEGAAPLFARVDDG